MTAVAKRWIIYCVVIFTQIIVNNYVNLGPMVYICLLPLLIAYLPLEQPAWLSMLEAFAMGLAVDLLSDGVMGLNAGAAVLTAVVARPLFYPIFNKNNYSKKFIPSMGESSLWVHLRYFGLILIVYFAFYISFDGLTARTFVTSLSRLAFDVLTSLAVILLVDWSLFNNR
ncbi:MAG: hypothetical protein HUJ91_03265 [Bacteroidales bacterium]|nr:hypothetical protein [Bacteroidales bacterium]